MCDKYVLVLSALFLVSLNWSAAKASLFNVLEENVITIDTIVDETGGWEDVRIEMDPGFAPNDTSVEVKRSLVEQDGKKKVVINLSIKGSFDGFSRTPLKFHHKGGKNTVVSNGGLTAKRINELSDEGNAGVLTNRALANEEMFRVRIDRIIHEYSTFIGIGVTNNNPKTMDYLGWMQCGTMMLYNNQFYENDRSTMKDYGPNLKTLKVGDIIGVMKKQNGDLHFFVNGRDLGVTAKGINFPVHGVLDLYGNAVEATLIP